MSPYVGLLGAAEARDEDVRAQGRGEVLVGNDEATASLEGCYSVPHALREHVATRHDQHAVVVEPVA